MGWLLAVLFFPAPLPAQGPETLARSQTDTLISTSAEADSTDLSKSPSTESSDVDTTISYAAKSIEFFLAKKTTVLRGDASVEYEGMTLKAAQIIVAWDQNLITAEGIPDTIWADSLKTKIDTVIVRGPPVFSEGDQQITGAKMIYNLKTRRGKVTQGRTAYSDGFYWGANIKKEPGEVLYVGPGSFTTCEKKEPHYCFYSSKMKLIRGDKVVAEPIVLYFGEVPVAAIPYGVFPAKRGRHSGIVVPTYGESGSQGRFIHHLGYYWATNDYMDLTGTLDYYEESGFLFHAMERYNWRYHLSGTLDGSYINQHFGSQKKRRWELKWGHDQVISPDTRLRVNANIISDGSYYRDYSFNLNEQLSQTLRSDATLTHSFPGTKNSMSINLHHEQNLLNDEISQSIPRVSFRHGQSAIFPLPKKTPGDTTTVETHWYNNLYYSYSGEALHQRVLDEVTTAADTSLVQTRRAAAKHNISFNSPQKFFGCFSLTPAINYREDWFDESYDYTQNPDGIKKTGFAARRTFTSSLGLSTKLYGFWMNPFPGVEAVRHTMTPSVSLNYRPDFSDPSWGYYQAVDDAGTTVLKDRFAGSLYGSTPKGKQLSLGFAVQNLFQMKYGSSEEKKKRDLFTINLSSSYNFAADSLNFAPLRTSFRASPVNRGQKAGPLESLSFDLSTMHSFYKVGPSGQYHEYYFDPGAGKILRLLNFDVSANTKLSIGTLVHSRDAILKGGELSPETVGTAAEGTFIDTTLSPPTKKNAPERWFMGQVPWDLGLSFHYTTNRTNPANPTETFWMNASVDASLTRNWQLSYNTRVDLIEHKVISAGLTVYRDLHCWEARFVWNPLGIAQGYYLKINIKSTALQDIKVERRRGQGSFMGF